jgi:hypothetical protein
VTRRSDQLEHPAAEVVTDDLLGPALDAEERLHGRQLAVDDHGPRPVGELPVSGDMVGMAVRMGDHELVVLSRVLGQPRVDDAIDGRAQGVVAALLARPGVEQDTAVVAEEQVEEGSLRI